MFRLFAVAAAILFATPVFAANFSTIYSVQSALKDHGYTTAKPDGKIGPSTRRAISAFAKDYGSEPTIDATFSKMIELSVRAREEVIDPEKLSEITAAVAEGMKDPDSAKIRKVSIQKGPKIFYICGEVNGKNSYGAYAGYTQFAMPYAPGIDPPLSPYGGAMIDEDMIFVCLTTFPDKP